LTTLCYHVLYFLVKLYMAAKLFFINNHALSSARCLRSLSLLSPQSTLMRLTKNFPRFFHIGCHISCYSFLVLVE